MGRARKDFTNFFVHTVTYWWASASIDYYTSYVENLQNVTREDITRYVQTYIKDKPRATGILLSPSMRDDMLLNMINL